MPELHLYQPQLVLGLNLCLCFMLICLTVVEFGLNPDYSSACLHDLPASYRPGFLTLLMNYPLLGTSTYQPVTSCLLPSLVSANHLAVAEPVPVRHQPQSAISAVLTSTVWSTSGLQKLPILISC